MKYIIFLNQQAKRAEAQGLEKEAIKLLMLELSGKNGAEFVAMLHDEISEQEQNRLLNEIKKYIEQGIPVQHIIGYTYFYGNKIKVNNNVSKELDLMSNQEALNLVTELFR